jgi:hypothetical protein
MACAGGCGEGCCEPQASQSGGTPSNPFVAAVREGHLSSVPSASQYDKYEVHGSRPSVVASISDGNGEPERGNTVSNGPPPESPTAFSSGSHRIRRDDGDARWNRTNGAVTTFVTAAEIWSHVMLNRPISNLDVGAPVSMESVGCGASCKASGIGVAFALIKTPKYGPTTDADKYDDTSKANINKAIAKAGERAMMQCGRRASANCWAKKALLCYCSLKNNKVVGDKRYVVKKKGAGTTALNVAWLRYHSAKEKEEVEREGNRLEFEDETKRDYKWADAVMIVWAFADCDGECYQMLRFWF